MFIWRGLPWLGGLVHLGKISLFEEAPIKINPFALSPGQFFVELQTHAGIIEF